MISSMKRLLKAFLKLFLSKEFLQKRRMRLAHMPLQKYGDEALSLLTNCFNDLNVRFSVIFGTLLGAYREHGFIKHDDDLDVLCDIKYLSKELIYSLQRKGFEINRIYVSSDKIGVQMPMKYKELTCDVYFAYDDNASEQKHIYLPFQIENKNWEYSVTHNIFSVCNITISSPKNFISTKFNDYGIKIPQNTDAILKELYGENYMMSIEGKKAYRPCFALKEKFFSCLPIDLFFLSDMLEIIQQKSK